MALDDISSVKDVLVDSDIYVQHYNHDLAWNGEFNAKDLIIKPATGGKIMAGLLGWEIGAGIVEQGSNANGEYVRFSNGAQWCWRGGITGLASTSLLASFFGSTSGNSWWGDNQMTFAAAFLAGTAPAVASMSSARATSSGTENATGFKLRCAHSSSFANHAGNYIAIGRWK